MGRAPCAPNAQAPACNYQPEPLAGMASAVPCCGAVAGPGGAGKCRFFRSSPARHGQGSGWGAVTQRLISAGHSWQAIPHYTLPQAKLFLAAIDQAERDQYHMALIASRAAQIKDQDFKRLLKDVRP